MIDYILSQDFWEFNARVVAPMVSGIAVLIVSILAIWGDQIKPKPKLRLHAKNLSGEYAEFRDKMGNAKPAYFYHLVVENTASVLAKNVRVLCRDMLRKDTGSLNYQRENINYPLQFTWTPAETAQITPNIIKDHSVDLGYVEHGLFILRFLNICLIAATSQPLPKRLYL